MAIIGKNWGTGICIPWDSWPPTQPPTIPYVEPKPVDPSQVTLRVVLVPKKDGGERFCIDFRPVNEVTQKDVYPLPRTVEMLDTP